MVEYICMTKRGFRASGGVAGKQMVTRLVGLCCTMRRTELSNSASTSSPKPTKIQRWRHTIFFLLTRFESETLYNLGTHLLVRLGSAQLCLDWLPLDHWIRVCRSGGASAVRLARELLRSSCHTSQCGTCWTLRKVGVGGQIRRQGRQLCGFCLLFCYSESAVISHQS